MRRLIPVGLAACLIAALAFGLVQLLDGEDADERPIAQAEPRLCTQIGCSSGIGVHVYGLRKLPEAKVLRLCEGDVCSETVLRPHTVPYVFLPMDFDEPEEVNPVLSIVDGDGQLLAEDETETSVARFYPNGKDCDDGSCISVGLRYHAATGNWKPGY